MMVVGELRSRMFVDRNFYGSHALGVFKGILRASAVNTPSQPSESGAHVLTHVPTRSFKVVFDQLPLTLLEDIGKLRFEG
jgi:hypothetical protein